MKKVLYYFTVGLIIIKIIVWYFDNRLKDNLTMVIESTDDRESQIDSIRTLRIKTERIDSLKKLTTNIDSLDNGEKELIQNLKNEERRLLKISLRQYIEVKKEINKHLEFLDLIESIVNVLFVLTIGTLVFKLIKEQ